MFMKVTVISRFIIKLAETMTKAQKKFSSDEEKYDFYFKMEYFFEETKREAISKGTYNDGTLEKFISRSQNKLTDKRLDFLLGNKVEAISFKEALQQILSYQNDKYAHLTIIDLSGVPFEVLSITVSLITRLVFE